MPPCSPPGLAASISHVTLTAIDEFKNKPFRYQVKGNEMPSTESMHLFLNVMVSQAWQKYKTLRDTLRKGSEDKCIWFLLLLRKV